MSSAGHSRFVSVTINNNEYQDITETKSVDESQDNNICTICYSSIEDDTKTTLKCGHVYHTECYTTYIAYNVVKKKETITCPVCRNDILEIVNKPRFIQIITGNNDIESQSEYDDNNIVQLGCCNTTLCCKLLIVRLMIVGAVYCVLHFVVYCGYSDKC